MLRVQVPVILRDLIQDVSKSLACFSTSARGRNPLLLTESGEMSPSGAPLLNLCLYSARRGMSMPPSMMACATWTPRGWNSLASDCVMALAANLPAAKLENFALPLIEAVAPVTIRDGGCGDESTDSRSKGSVFWAKWKRPWLCVVHHHTVRRRCPARCWEGL